MKTNLRKLALTTLFAIGMTAVASNAMANCNDIGNSEWNNLALAMGAAVDAQNYEEALNSAKRMSLICDREPSLNYSMSRIYAKMGDEKNAAVYAKKATDYISDYQVQPALAERIWMTRAEYELPYKADLEALQAKTADYDAIKADYEARVQQEKETAIRNEYLADRSRGNWWNTMWAGVGIMGGGLIMTIVGSVLVTTSDKVEFDKKNTDPKKSGFSVTKSYVAGWTLLGLGIASTVFGGVMTGIAGYGYTHTDKDGNVDTTVSFDVAPTSLSLEVTF